MLDEFLQVGEFALAEEFGEERGVVAGAVERFAEERGDRDAVFAMRRNCERFRGGDDFDSFVGGELCGRLRRRGGRR